MNCFTISDINSRQARKPGELAGAHGGLMDPSPDLKSFMKFLGKRTQRPMVLRGMWYDFTAGIALISDMDFA